MKYLNYLFNTDSLKESRLPWMDFAKGVAIIFVVYRHILIGLNRSGFVYDDLFFNAAEVGVTFRMHLFFILAGIFIRKSISKRSNEKFVFDKLKTLIYPYLIWTTIQISLQLVMIGHTNSQRTWMDYIYIITQPRAIDQFWFIYALFNVSILYLFLFRITNGNRWILAIIGILMYGAAPFANISVLDDILDYFLFLVIGDFVASFLLNSENKKYFNLYTLVILLVLFSFQLHFFFNYELNYFYLAILALTGCAFTINLALQVSNTALGQFFRVFGFHSLFIFLMHSMVAAFVRIILVKAVGLHDAVTLLVICSIAGCVFPIMIYNFMIKNHLWIFFAPNNPNKKPQLSAA